ncbi:MAG: putative phosphosugar isomerase [Nitrosopumilales archaeon]|nr:MAG: putative phosphosugar isomerase [Nitrosopumilales archaeon]
MKTIEAFEQDILLQVLYIQKIKLQKQLSIKKQKNTIFCGSGDSLAAALLAESFSNFRIRAADPLDLLKNRSIIKKNQVYIISISGNTVSNINVAKIAQSATAITLNKNSKLVKICSKYIALNYPNSGVFTSGSIGFITSALTCISLVSKFRLRNVSKLFKKALTNSKKIKLGKKVFILGNLHTFPIAMYAAAKFYEVLGIDAHYERIEQFLHMGLFSVKQGDTVIIFEEKNSHNSRITKNLKKLGLNVFQPNGIIKDKISQIIFFTFFSQLTPLFFAKKNHQKECYFVSAKKLRAASSNMIY